MSGPGKFANLLHRGRMHTPRKETAPEKTPVVTVAGDLAAPSHPDLSTRVVGSSSQVHTIPDDSPPPPQKGKRNLAEGDGGRASKKSRHGREMTDKRHRSLPFSMGEFLAEGSEEFKTDPIGVSLRVFKHMADLSKAQLEVAEGRAKETLSKKDREISDLKREKEADTKRLQDLQARLERAEADAEAFKKAADDAKADANTALDSLSSSKNRITQLEAELGETRGENARLKEDLSKTIEESCTLVEASFENALEQVGVVYPSFAPDREIVRMDHEVVDGKIVGFNVETKEMIPIFPLP